MKPRAGLERLGSPLDKNSLSRSSHLRASLEPGKPITHPQMVRRFSRQKIRLKLNAPPTTTTKQSNIRNADRDDNATDDMISESLRPAQPLESGTASNHNHVHFYDQAPPNAASWKYASPMQTQGFTQYQIQGLTHFQTASLPLNLHDLNDANEKKNAIIQYLSDQNKALYLEIQALKRRISSLEEQIRKYQEGSQPSQASLPRMSHFNCAPDYISGPRMTQADIQQNRQQRKLRISPDAGDNSQEYQKPRVRVSLDKFAFDNSAVRSGNQSTSNFALQRVQKNVAQVLRSTKNLWSLSQQVEQPHQLSPLKPEPIKRKSSNDSRIRPRFTFINEESAAQIKEQEAGKSDEREVQEKSSSEELSSSSDESSSPPPAESSLTADTKQIIRGVWRIWLENEMRRQERQKKRPPYFKSTQYFMTKRNYRQLVVFRRGLTMKFLGLRYPFSDIQNSLLQRPSNTIDRVEASKIFKGLPFMLQDEDVTFMMGFVFGDSAQSPAQLTLCEFCNKIRECLDDSVQSPQEIDSSPQASALLNELYCDISSNYDEIIDQFRKEQTGPGVVSEEIFRSIWQKQGYKPNEIELLLVESMTISSNLNRIKFEEYLKMVVEFIK